MSTSTSKSEAEPESERSVVIERVIDAPARLLFQAYTKPEHVMRWFGPPGYPLTHCEMNFREGGSFKFQMTGPDGQGGPPFGGTYLSIVPNKRIQYDNGFLDEHGFSPGRMIVTITFDELVVEKKTKLTLHTLFESVKMMSEHVGMGYVDGVTSCFDAFVSTANDIERTMVVTRVIAAPARLLFEAYTKPEHLMRWYGPYACKLTLCELDFRVGGAYRFAMTGTDGKEQTPFGGTYREIVAGKRIVYDDSDQNVTRVTFDEAKDGKSTTLQVSTVFVRAETLEQRKKSGAEAGVLASMKLLEDVVLELASMERV